VKTASPRPTSGAQDDARSSSPDHGLDPSAARAPIAIDGWRSHGFRPVDGPTPKCRHLVEERAIRNAAPRIGSTGPLRSRRPPSSKARRGPLRASRGQMAMTAPVAHRSGVNIGHLTPTPASPTGRRGRGREERTTRSGTGRCPCSPARPTPRPRRARRSERCPAERRPAPARARTDLDHEHLLAVKGEDVRRAYERVDW
jgi:hypothetical protein